MIDFLGKKGKFSNEMAMADEHSRCAAKNRDTVDRYWFEKVLCVAL